MVRSSKSAPTDYTTPPFPSLYNPVNVLPGKAYYLFYASDIWRFTLYWTLIIYAAAHLGVVLCAVTTQWRNWKLVWGMPLVYGVIGGLEGVLAGSVVGLVLGALYEAGNFMMTTWLPFIWACMNVLVVILSSFSIQGGL